MTSLCSYMQICLIHLSDVVKCATNFAEGEGYSLDDQTISFIMLLSIVQFIIDHATVNTLFRV